MRLEGAAFRLADACPGTLVLKDDGHCHLGRDSGYEAAPGTDFQNWRQLPRALPKVSPAAIDLGRLLFFDPVLSGDQTLSCAHCHHPRFGMGDGRRLSMGRGGTGVGPARRGGATLPRSAPALWNLAFQSVFFWDGRSASLSEQALEPLLAADEMHSSVATIEARLNVISAYRDLFNQAFPGDKAAAITIAQVTAALVAFEVSLVSLNSAYDRFLNGQADALTAQQINGLGVFRSFVTRCAECHTPPLFTNQQFAVIGVPSPGKFDEGVGAHIQDGDYRGAFKIPSLRNIARSAPYMHAGNLADLPAVVSFYNNGAGLDSKAVPAARLHWHIRRMDLGAEEQEALVAFLQALTDESHVPEIPKQVPSGLAIAR